MKPIFSDIEADPCKRIIDSLACISSDLRKNSLKVRVHDGRFLDPEFFGSAIRTRNKYFCLTCFTEGLDELISERTRAFEIPGFATKGGLCIRFMLDLCPLRVSLLREKCG